MIREIKFIVTGDETQIDLPRRSDSGMLQAIRILKGIDDISIVKFDQNDIVRHKLVRDIVAAYEKYQDELDAKREAQKEEKNEFKSNTE